MKTSVCRCRAAELAHAPEPAHPIGSVDRKAVAPARRCWSLTQAIWLPVNRAAIELQRSHPEKAIELLQSVSQYKAGAGFWRIYLRGQAYWRLKRSAEAAAEFQKILDHRRWGRTSYLYQLAHLGLARAAELTGDTAKSRKAYQDFFALWKDADADLPVLIEARSTSE